MLALRRVLPLCIWLAAVTWTVSLTLAQLPSTPAQPPVNDSFQPVVDKKPTTWYDVMHSKVAGRVLFRRSTLDARNTRSVKRRRVPSADNEQTDPPQLQFDP